MNKRELRWEIAQRLGWKIMPNPEPNALFKTLLIRPSGNIGAFDSIPDASFSDYGKTQAGMKEWPDYFDQAIELFHNLPSSMRWRLEYFPDGVPGYRKSEGCYSFQILEYSIIPAQAIAETPAEAVCETWIKWDNIQQEVKEALLNIEEKSRRQELLLKRLLFLADSFVPFWLDGADVDQIDTQLLVQMQKKSWVVSEIMLGRKFFQLTEEGKRVAEKGNTDGKA